MFCTQPTQSALSSLKAERVASVELQMDTALLSEYSTLSGGGLMYEINAAYIMYRYSIQWNLR